MHPYAAKMLVSQGPRTLAGRPRARRSRALADLEFWSRGGEDYPEDVALTLALKRAVERLAEPARTWAARAFLRAPVLRCSAPFWTALSMRETSALCSASAA